LYEESLSRLLNVVWLGTVNKMAELQQ